MPHVSGNGSEGARTGRLPAELERVLAGFDAGRAVLQEAPRGLPLTGGMTNCAWRVTTRSVDWVVRVGGERDGALAIDRRAELAALRAAAAAGLAPSCIHADPGRGVLVLQFVAGRVWSRDDARSAAGIARFAARLRDLHALPLPLGLPTFGVAATLDRYLELSPAQPGPLDRSVLAECVTRALHGYRPRGAALCHHDLHHLNIVDTGRLVFLDWEYAAVGDPLLDLAGYACYHDLDRHARERLAQAYGAGEAGALEEACRVFDCLQALWHDAAGTWQKPGSAARAGLIARLQDFATRPMDSG